MVVNSNRFNFKEIYDLYLAEYAEKDVLNALDETVNEVSKEAVKRLKHDSPKRRRNGGGYAKGWKREKEKGRLKVGYTIYNEKPGLPHLLEHGHVKRSGGRTDPIVHIEPVEQWAIKEATERFIKKVEGV